jgi:hypothetical protein
VQVDSGESASKRTGREVRELHMQIVGQERRIKNQAPPAIWSALWHHTDAMRRRHYAIARLCPRFWYGKEFRPARLGCVNAGPEMLCSDIMGALDRVVAQRCGEKDHQEFFPEARVTTNGYTQQGFSDVKASMRSGPTFVEGNERCRSSSDADSTARVRVRLGQRGWSD